MPTSLAALAVLLTAILLAPAQADDGLSLSYDELESEFARQRRQAVDEYIFNRYLRERADAEGVELQALQQRLLAVPEPDTAMIERFYQANRERIEGSLEQVRPQLSQYLQNQLLAKRQTELLEQIRRDKEYEVRIETPEPPRFRIDTRGHPSKGPDDAAVTVVEFADYQCPHCNSARAAVAKVLQRFEGKVRVVFRDFPINRSGISRKVAIGAVCAREQGRFWAYHDLAFDRQDYLRVVTPAMLAKELELDQAAFEQCYEDPRAEQVVAESEAEATRLGLSGTPTFFVNGLRLHIHGDIESSLSEAVASALGESG